MIPRVPIPQGPILDWIQSEYQGEGHGAKERVVRETADIANKVLASYDFYVDSPAQVTDEHRRKFREDVERYGKQAVELRTFALQSDAPTPEAEDVEAMVAAQKRLLADDSAEVDGLLGETLGKLGVEHVPDVDPEETLDAAFGKIDDPTYLMYYGILEQIVRKCAGCAVDGDIEPRDFAELEVSLKTALERFSGSPAANS
jgi:hypothetical protein